MKQANFKGTVICSDKPDNTFILDDLSCCEVLVLSHQREDNESRRILCRVYNNTESAFSEPCDSKKFGVYEINRASSCMKLMRKGDLPTKIVEMEDTPKPLKYCMNS